jgi:hypothetical protein
MSLFVLNVTNVCVCGGQINNLIGDGGGQIVSNNE